MKLDPLETSKEFKTFMQGFFTDIYKDGFAKKLQNDLSKSNLSYLEAVDKLAYIDPILAYQLNGKLDISSAMDEMDKGFEKFIHMLSEENIEIDKEDKESMEMTKIKIMQRFLEELEADLVIVAKKINLRVLYQTKRMIRNVKVHSLDDLENELDKLIDNLQSAFSDQKL